MNTRHKTERLQPHILSLLSYELRLIRSVGRLFGRKKALEFVLSLPLVMVSRENRSAYENIAPCVVVVEGRKVVLPHPDARFLEEIVAERCYTSREGFEIGNRDIVIDLGANVGTFTILAAMKASEGRVIAVEPEAENFKFLCENVKANSLLHVEPHKFAISNTDGFVNLSVTHPGNNAISTEPLAELSVMTQMVESVSIGGLLSRLQIPRVDFVKMDIEGAEFLAFQDQAWLKQVRRIAMEVHPDKGDTNLIRQRLEALDFAVEITPAYDVGMLYLYARRT